jgi:cytoskeletal protein CcmA (bactofilin family)
MFKKSSPEPMPPAPRGERSERKEQSFLQSGVKLDGDLVAEGDLRVEGQITGTIRVSGLLTIGAKAEVEGIFTGNEVVVHGKLHGTIQSEGRIHLAREAKVTGDLYCKGLVIEEGVVFQGSSNMGEKAAALKAEKAPAAPPSHVPPAAPGVPDRTRIGEVAAGAPRPPLSPAAHGTFPQAATVSATPRPAGDSHERVPAPPPGVPGRPPAGPARGPESSSQGRPTP